MEELEDSGGESKLKIAGERSEFNEFNSMPNLKLIGSIRTLVWWSVKILQAHMCVLQLISYAAMQADQKAS